MARFYQQHRTTILVFLIVASMIGNAIVAYRTWFSKKTFGVGKQIASHLPEDIAGFFGEETGKEKVLKDVPQFFAKDIFDNPVFIGLRPFLTVEEKRPFGVLVSDDSAAQFAGVTIHNSETGSEAIVTWERAASSDSAEIAIYRSTVFGTPGSKVAVVPAGAHSWHDTTVERGRVYYYAFAAVLGDGREWGISQQYPVIVRDTVAPPSPKNVSLISADESRVTISWENPTVDDFSYARIYRSRVPGRSGTLLADRISRTEFTDTTVEPGAHYFYTVTAVDESLNESPRKTFSGLTMSIFDKLAVFGFDTALSVSDVDIKGDGIGNRVALSWHNPTDKRFCCVRIYRSVDSANRGERIAERGNDEMSYRDESVVTGQLYYYTLQSVDALGQESGESVRLPVVARDTVPPSYPGSVTIEQQGPDTVTLSWDASPEADVEYYRVYRSSIPGDTGYLVADRITDLSWQDAITGKTVYYYTITAVDTSGNESVRPFPGSIRGGRVPFAPKGATSTTPFILPKL